MRGQVIIDNLKRFKQFWLTLYTLQREKNCSVCNAFAPGDLVRLMPLARFCAILRSFALPLDFLQPKAESP